MRRHVALWLALGGLTVLAAAATATADDVSVSTDIAGVGEGVAQTFTHPDGGEFKGWFNLTIQNSGSVPWGDFHFEIIGLGEDVSNVDFIVAPPFAPLSTQAPLTWSVDNVSVGAKLDLYFYSDPVGPGELATFSVYTDNTVNSASQFGMLVYPTPVIPEPATLLLLAGAIPLIARRRSR